MVVLVISWGGRRTNHHPEEDISAGGPWRRFNKSPRGEEKLKKKWILCALPVGRRLFHPRRSEIRKRYSPRAPSRPSPLRRVVSSDQTHGSYFFPVSLEINEDHDYPHEARLGRR